MITPALVEKVCPTKISVSALKLLMLIEANLKNEKFDQTNDWLFKEVNRVFKQKYEPRTIQLWLEELKQAQLISVVQIRRKHKRIIRMNYRSKKPEELEYDEMSEEQKMFQDAFPQRIVNADVPEHIDMELLIKKIKAQDRLMKLEFASLDWCIRNYNDIIAEKKYANPSISTALKDASTARHYSPQNLNSDLKSAAEIKV